MTEEEVRLQARRERQAFQRTGFRRGRGCGLPFAALLIVFLIVRGFAVRGRRRRSGLGRRGGRAEKGVYLQTALFRQVALFRQA